jgi:hypothetical protein
MNKNFKTLADCIAALDALRGTDPEDDHHNADQILLAALRLLGATEIPDAYNRLIERCPWWATA